MIIWILWGFEWLSSFVGLYPLSAEMGELENHTHDNRGNRDTHYKCCECLVSQNTRDYGRALIEQVGDKITRGSPDGGRR